MIYPAVRVQYDGAKFFKQPSDVEDFLSDLPASALTCLPLLLPSSRTHPVPMRLNDFKTGSMFFKRD